MRDKFLNLLVAKKDGRDYCYLACCIEDLGRDVFEAVKRLHQTNKGMLIVFEDVENDSEVWRKVKQKRNERFCGVKLQNLVTYEYDGSEVYSVTTVIDMTDKTLDEALTEVTQVILGD